MALVLTAGGVKVGGRGQPAEPAKAGSRSAGDDKVPRSAVAAATRGETRWVRPPFPCLPSKFRLDVGAERSPGSSWSGFIDKHIEQPAERHSAPPAVNTRSRPSASACAFRCIEPGTTSMRRLEAM